MTTRFASAPGLTVEKTVRYCALCHAVYRSDFQWCPNDGGPLELSSTDPLIGETIDHYVIDALIGEGAMGRVYRAHHSRLINRRYAVKVLLGDLAASSQMRARFAQEAENASRLDHPNAVGVIDFGRTALGLQYIVMDLVEGTTLSEILRAGPLSPARVIRIAHQLCEALDHAHGRGVIHRDFKPENILVVGEAGRDLARIADFGLALSVTSDVRLTTTGVACTPAYAAPEQLRTGTFDHRVDLYGLGVTMFEMLSGGILPFGGTYDEAIGAKLAHDAPSILTVAPNVPPGLVALVARLLARDPNQRPRSAQAVIHALEGALQSPGVLPQSSASAEPAAPPRRRSGAALVVAILAIATGTLIGWTSDSPPTAQLISAHRAP